MGNPFEGLAAALVTMLLLIVGLAFAVVYLAVPGLRELLPLHRGHIISFCLGALVTYGLAKFIRGMTQG